MRESIFLSYSRADKKFVGRLAQDLERQGVNCWLDEAEIKAGDSLTEKIRDGVDNVTFFAVVLSQNSINAAWVQHEIELAMNLKSRGKLVRILPIMLELVELPSSLSDIRYVDFTRPSKYEASFADLVKSIGIVFSRSAFLPTAPRSNLGDAIDKSILLAIPLLSKPFHRPFQYIGSTVQRASDEVGEAPNSVGNIIVDREKYRMFLEAEGNFISFVQIEFKQTKHFQNKEFDSEVLLGALSVSPSELELVEKLTHFHNYYDHHRKLKVGVACEYDGGPLSVSFGTKYFGM